MSGSINLGSNFGVGQVGAVSHASMMAHAAARNANAQKMLGGSGAGAPGATGGSWQSTVADHMAAAGTPVGPADIHNAVGSLVHAGHFTAPQGHALVAHNGPLAGAEGLSTMAAVAHMAMAHKGHLPAGA